MKQRLHPLFGQKHQDYIRRAVRSTVSVAEGAVRAGKTIDNIAAFAYMIDRGVPDKFHLATGSTSANAKLNIGTANGFGLESIFRGRCRWIKFRGNDALSIMSHGREYVVIFAGGAKADSYKKIRGNSYGMWIATEINLHHEETIREAFNRQLAARVRRVFWDLNPSAPGHWIYEHYIDRFAEQFGDQYTYQHFTIRDNLTVTPQRLEEIERQYRQYGESSVWYRRDILGERCNAEGLVYPMFGDDCLTDGRGGPGVRYISMDYGTINPTAMGLWCIHEDGTATMEREYYHDSRATNRQKTDEEYYKDLEAFAGDEEIKAIIIDPSAASFKETIRRHHKFHVMDANNDVLDGIRTTSTLLAEGRIKIHTSCTATRKEFAAYQWDTEKASDAVVKQYDHSMDQMRYFCHTLRHKLRPKKPRPTWANYYL